VRPTNEPKYRGRRERSNALAGGHREAQTPVPNDNDDGDGEVDEGETNGHPSWQTARYVTRLVAEQITPLLSTAVAATVRHLRYEDRSYLPRFVTTRLTDPFLALRNCVDESLIFERGIADISDAFMRQAAASSAAESKTRSLRRTLTMRGSRATVALDDSSLPGTLGVLDEQKRIAKIITAEAERVAARLSVVSEVFVAQLATLLNIRDRQLHLDMRTFAPHILVHPSVARHASLGKLRLGDCTLILELGRAYMREFILLETYAQAYRIDNAERRCETLSRHADAWLAEHFNAAAVADMLPVDWFLDEKTHEPLDDVVLDARREAMRREVPFMMIGFLHAMRMNDERDLVVWSIFQKLI